MLEFNWGKGTCVAKKIEQRIPKVIACAGDACPAGLGSGTQIGTPTSAGVQDYVLGFCSFARSGSLTVVC